jgi:hypothetical protein
MRIFPSSSCSFLVLIGVAHGLSACGGGAGGSAQLNNPGANSNVVSNPVPQATFTSIHPTSNVVAGMPSSSFSLVGTNLLGVSFQLGQNSCESNYLATSGSSDVQIGTIKCDVPVGSSARLSVKDSTNGSGTSGIGSYEISLVAADTVPTISSVSPLTVQKGSKVSFTLIGTHINAFNSNRHLAGLTYNGQAVWCMPWVNAINADNTSGKVEDCLIPDAAGSGSLKWYYNYGQNSVDFGTLTVTN